MSTRASVMAGRRLALLIATSQYSDPDLGQLRSPGRDAHELALVLRDPRIGGFDVETMINAGSGEVQEKIEEFCAERRPDDHLMIYLSCHGVLDASGRLYYAATNTRRQRLAATAIAAVWLNERLEDCRARRQIVVLDCCHSGAFARGAKGDDALALRHRFEPHGRGRVVLTASRSTEYSFEGDQVSGEGVRSVFTHAMVDGLRTGDADRDKDGLITVNDLYHYVSDKVRSAEPRQTPELWLYAAEGDLLVAHSVRGAVIEPEALPEDLRVTLESPRHRVRETGVAELAELLDTAKPGLVLTARQELQRIVAGDHPRVATAARAALTAPAGTAADQVRKELAELDRQEQARRAAQEKARRQQAEKARRQAEEARRQAEEKARRQAEEEARRQAEEKARRQAEAQKTPTAAIGSGIQPGRDSLAPRSSLKGWRARRRLSLLIAVPALALVALGGIRITSATQSALAYQRVLQLTTLSSDITVLAQRLEDERDQTVYYIALGAAGGRSAPAADKVVALGVVRSYQRETDRATLPVQSQLQEIGSSFPARTQQEATIALSELDALSQLRDAATGTALPALDVSRKYTGLIDDLLLLEDTTGQGASDATLAQGVRLLGLVSQMKEDASEQRAILAAALIQHNLTAEAQGALTNAQLDQAANLGEFDLTATAAQRQLFNSTGTGPDAYLAPNEEQQAINLQTNSGSLVGDQTHADDWYSAESHIIKFQMGAVERSLVNQIAARADALRSSEIVSGVVAGLLLGALALLFTAVLLPSRVWPIHGAHQVPRAVSPAVGTWYAKNSRIGSGSRTAESPPKDQADQPNRMRR